MGDPKGMKGGPEDPSAWGELRMCALQAWVTCPPVLQMFLFMVRDTD